MDLHDQHAILVVMDQYFDGLYKADPVALQGIFHDDLRYVNATAGDHVAHDLEAYLQIVDSRIPPDRLGDRRNPQITQIHQVSERIIFVQATMSMMGRDYVDALTLMATDQGWKIVAKIFSTLEQGAE